ncbi:MAG: putative hydrolase of the superfamily [Actinomycetota bacterium]|nr:putative hydrolase of the superfamily [Actinomycetota bacterium]
MFDYGGVISSPLFVGIGAFEAAEGYARGSLLRLLFGDVGYVGVEGRAVADAIVSDPDAIEMSGEVTDEPDWHLLEKGIIDFAAYFERITEKAPAVLGKPLDPDAYGRFMRSTAPGVHWMVVHKIRELQARGLRLGLLTNNIKEFGEHWRATFPIDELFEYVVDSSHVGMRKPDREIYELMCGRMGIAPSDAIFVDDNLDNVAAARAYGMEAVHFGEDPWRALNEIDAILERRGIAP